jgi:hypothetical protein
MTKMSETEIRYSDKYPDIQLGFGTRFGKFRFRQIFTGRFWRDLRIEIRNAWHRAMRGYDGFAVWDMKVSLRMQIIRCLLELADCKNSAPEPAEWEGKLPPLPTGAWSDEAEELLTERINLWKLKLAEIAGHFYESLDYAEYQQVKNEFEEEYRKSYTSKLEHDESGGEDDYIFTTGIPKDGYTQEQADELRDKYHAREAEIKAYKREQLELGMKKLTEVFDHLWD